MAQTFSAQVDKWVLETKERTEAVFKKSTERVIEDMQKPVAKGGNLPVDTGFLRSSLQFSLNNPPAGGASNASGGSYTYNNGVAAMTIAGADLGDTIWATYSANYAKYVHDGANGRPGRPWVRLSAQKWQTIVNQVVSELR